MRPQELHHLSSFCSATICRFCWARNTCVRFEFYALVSQQRERVAASVHRQQTVDCLKQFNARRKLKVAAGASSEPRLVSTQSARNLLPVGIFWQHCGTNQPNFLCQSTASCALAFSYNLQCTSKKQVCLATEFHEMHSFSDSALFQICLGRGKLTDWWLAFDSGAVF